MALYQLGLFSVVVVTIKSVVVVSQCVICAESSFLTYGG